MSDVPQLLVSGIALGSVYSLIALGFVLVWKSSSVLNFAHGSFVMLSAYLAYSLLVVAELPFLLALVIVCIAMGLLGVALHLGIMRRMVGKPFFSVVLITVGLEIIIRAGLLIAYGPLEKGRARRLPTGNIELGGGVILPKSDLIIMLAVAAVLTAFLVFFKHARLGLHMRAVAEDLESASVMGIRINHVYATAWGVGLVLAALGGVFYTQFAPAINLETAAIGLRAFPAALIGGLDSVSGAIVGGLIVAVAETLGAGLLGAQYREPIAFGVMFLVLFWRPTGLLGAQQIERV